MASRRQIILQLRDILLTYRNILESMAVKDMLPNNTVSAWLFRSSFNLLTWIINCEQYQSALCVSCDSHIRSICSAFSTFMLEFAKQIDKSKSVLSPLTQNGNRSFYSMCLPENRRQHISHSHGKFTSIWGNSK